MDYSLLSDSSLWSIILEDAVDDLNLYGALCELVLKFQECPSSQASHFFHPQSCPRFLQLLSEKHEPQVSIVVCTLLGYMCHLTSQSKEHLSQRGITEILLDLTKTDFQYSEDRPARTRLMKLLLEHVTSMLLFFSIGPHYCLKRILVTDAVLVLSRLIDSENPNYFQFDTPEKFQELVTMKKQNLVGEKFLMRSLSASSIFYQQLGDDFKSTVTISDSFVLDLYDTSGDDDIPIIDELSKKSSIWRYGSREDEIEIDVPGSSENVWVDVKVTHVINGAYFWAILSPDIDKFDELHKNLQALEFTDPLDKIPRPGDIVNALHVSRTIGIYRAQVFFVSDINISVVAIDYGFIETLPLRKLRPIGNRSEFKVPGLAKLCKIMGLLIEIVCR